MRRLSWLAGAAALALLGGCKQDDGVGTNVPATVNDVAAVFGEYVFEGSRRAAAGGDFSDAILDPGGSKGQLVADFAPFSMGSDHDVYQEGSFRVPTIYLNDWPDVFIHTNNDTPANIDPTKLAAILTGQPL